jgi:hypothetical protein
MKQMQDLMENSINKEFQERKRKRNKKMQYGRVQRIHVAALWSLDYGNKA